MHNKEIDLTMEKSMSYRLGAPYFSVDYCIRLDASDSHCSGLQPKFLPVWMKVLPDRCQRNCFLWTSKMNSCGDRVVNSLKSRLGASSIACIAAWGVQGTENSVCIVQSAYRQHHCCWGCRLDARILK